MSWGAVASMFPAALFDILETEQPKSIQFELINLQCNGPVVRQARFLCDENGVATNAPNPDYVAVTR